MSSPTVAKELVLITAAVDENDNYNMAVSDIPGSYLHTKLDGYTC